jgi:UDP-2-acetamido-2,6-beta-L-arabino-hexul-4-ose reductase
VFYVLISEPVYFGLIQFFLIMSITVGITGSGGLIGQHVLFRLAQEPDTFRLVPFERSMFDDEAGGALDAFVRQCDVIVHLAGINRDPDPEQVYRVNLNLARALRAAMERIASAAHLIIASSVQEGGESAYARSKRDARVLLAEIPGRGPFTGLIIPNTFGPFGRPFDNSFISTFCHQLVYGEQPKVIEDRTVQLIAAHELAEIIVGCIHGRTENPCMTVPHTREIAVSQVLERLTGWRDLYICNNTIPVFADGFELTLFNTLRSHIDPARRYPMRLVSHPDERGAFTEILRHNTGGQVSFSTTLPGITRGNHYHTRKVERFTVIRGEAVIRLRRIGTGEVLEFALSGAAPSYVDMPVFYTHSITNVGDEPLYTVFWINEPYDPADPDTFFVPVLTENHVFLPSSE